MKKLIIILGALALLSACRTETLISDPVRFEYDGHEYIYFPVSYYQNGVVHDPDCPCHNNEK